MLLFLCLTKSFFMWYFTDMNECEPDGENGCSQNAHCTNVIGSYNCKCNEGYSGDGFECEGNHVSAKVS